MRALLPRLIAIPLLAATAACTVHKTEEPSLSGPSGLAFQLNLTASPDRISQDGAMQSQIAVQAIGPQGQLMSGQTIRLDMTVNGALTDFGRLSARTVTTGSDGIARAVYTAPPPSVNQTPVTVVIQGTPVRGDSSEAHKFTTAIDLMPTGVILPPAGTPTAAFTVTPTPVGMLVPTTFDASASVAGTNATSITSYSWSWGDGSPNSTGVRVNHTFQIAGTFTVVLTVTNDRGLTATAQQTVTVANDTGAFNASDWITSPPFGSAFVIGQPILFNADAVRTTDGRQVTVFNWNFGDGDTTQPTTGFLVSHTFNAPGSYNVVLSVADELGRKKVFPPKAYVVGPGNPTASFTSSVQNTGTHTMTFDGSASTAVTPATVATYAWAFGDGGFAAASSSPTTNHSYASAGAYQVRLTVTDSAGRSSVFTATVTVP